MAHWELELQLEGHWAGGSEHRPDRHSIRLPQAAMAQSVLLLQVDGQVLDIQVLATQLFLGPQPGVAQSASTRQKFGHWFGSVH